MQASGALEVQREAWGSETIHASRVLLASYIAVSARWTASVGESDPSSKRAADGDRHRQRVPTGREGHVADQPPDALRELLEASAAPDSRGEDGDLLAAPAGHDVARPQPLLEPVHYLHQDDVACAVPEPVVDGLEAVDVDDEEARRLVAADDPSMGLDEHLLEGPPVRARS